MSGTAKIVRLNLGIDFRRRVLEKGGTDVDILLVQKEDPDFMDRLAKQLVERADYLGGSRTYFRLLHQGIAINMPALKRPTLRQLQADWDFIGRIESDNSTERPVTLRLATILRTTESCIDNDLCGRRLERLGWGGRLLGYQHLQYLRRVRHRYPALMAILRRFAIWFPGITVRDLDNFLHVPVVVLSDKKFWQWDSLSGIDIGSRFRIAVSAS